MVTSQPLAGCLNTTKTNEMLWLVTQTLPPENLIVCYDQQNSEKCELKISMEAYIQESLNTDFLVRMLQSGRVSMPFLAFVAPLIEGQLGTAIICLVVVCVASAACGGVGRESAPAAWS